MSYPGENATKRVEGMVMEAMPNALFRVELVTGRSIVAHVTQKARVTHVRFVPGEQVTVEIMPYDPFRGRILGRASRG